MATKSGVDHNTNGNSILLYHHHQSFYSQKVIFALAEKRLNFQSHIIQLRKFEQYEPWFMRLNPRGEVPVLKDGVKIIPDSSRIIDYLEDNFSNGDTPRLFPEKGSEEAQKVKYFREVIDEIPIEDLTVGCLLHPEFTENTKLPTFVQNRMKALRLRRFVVLQELINKHPDLKEHYEKKLAQIERVKEKQESKESLEKNLKTIAKLLDDVEKELTSHSTEQTHLWLCSEKFTVADICLSVLLNRLVSLGLATRYWSKGQRPCLAKYFQRLQRLDSYKRACLSVSTYEKMMYAVEMLKQKVPLILGTVVLFAALAVGVAYYKKFK